MRTILQLTSLDDTGDSCYRMRWPARELAERNPDWSVVNLDVAAKERFEWGMAADLLVLYQSADTDLLPVVLARRAAGRKTLVEYNDNFYAPPPWSPVAREWTSPLLWHRYERFMHLADGVIVTGPGLVELFSGRGGSAPVHVLENHLPTPPEAFEDLFPSPAQRVVVGWGGSLGHMADLLAVVPAVQSLMAEIPTIHLHLMGNATIPQIVSFPGERFHFTPWGGMPEYYAFWRPVHIGIAPLLDTPYNRCRSDIKAVEMAAMGVVPVLPDMVPYRRFLAATGLSGFGSVGEMVAQVRDYALNPQLLRETARRCWEYVRAERVGLQRVDRSELYAAHFPPAPVASPWPAGPGYHELAGTKQEHSPGQIVLRRAQAAINQQRREEAAGILAEACRLNPESADLALAEARCRRVATPEELFTHLASCRERFPGDLRFTLLELRCRKPGPELLNRWDEVARGYAAESPAYRRFFARELAATLSDQLSREPALRPVALRLVEPAFRPAQLRLALAEALERAGEWEQSREIFLTLAAEFDRPDDEFRLLASLDEKYLRAWSAALSARLATEP